MSEGKKRFDVPPEEGDLNTAAIGKGLTVEEMENLKKDLKAIESGRGSTEAPHETAPPLATTDRDFAREQETEQQMFEDWATSLNEGGLTEEEASVKTLWRIYNSPNTSGEDPELMRKIKEIEASWPEAGRHLR